MGVKHNVTNKQQNGTIPTMATHTKVWGQIGFPQSTSIPIKLWWFNSMIYS